MKKYITIFGFFALFLVGNQFAEAQQRTRSNEQTQRPTRQTQRPAQVAPEVIAKQKTFKLSQLVNLTGTQQGEVFKVFFDAEQNLQAINEQGGNSATVQSAREEILNYVETKLSVILTPDQMNIYRQSLAQESTNKASSTAKE